jgi:hypothetical protein
LGWPLEVRLNRSQLVLVGRLHGGGRCPQRP